MGLQYWHVWLLRTYVVELQVKQVEVVIQVVQPTKLHVPHWFVEVFK
jgi:hypothetical protein